MPGCSRTNSPQCDRRRADEHMSARRRQKASRWRCATLAAAAAGPELREEVDAQEHLDDRPTGCGKTEISRRLANSPTRRSSSRGDQVHRGRLFGATSSRRPRPGRGSGAARRERRRNAVKAAAEEAAMDRSSTAHRKGSSEPRGRASASVHRLQPRHRRGRDRGRRAPACRSKFPDGRADVRSEVDHGKAMGRLRAKRRKLRVPEAFARSPRRGRQAARPRRRHRAALADPKPMHVFLDEIDKIASRRARWAVSPKRPARPAAADEGTTVATSTPLKTDHMLFIASGAFHMPSRRLLPELQGRLPIRVELKA